MLTQVRHFLTVKRLAENVKLMSMANPDNLNSDAVNVFICDFIFCRICTGGNRELLLSGKPAWNFVICGEIGKSVKLVFNATLGTRFAFCEVAPFGIEGSNPSHLLQLIA